MANFIFDIDGTLCEDSDEINVKNLEILREIKSKGHNIFYATGRGFEALKDALGHDLVLLDTIAVCENGSKVFSSNQLLESFSFTQKEVNLIVEFLNKTKENIRCIDFWIGSQLLTNMIDKTFSTPFIENKYRKSISFNEAIGYIKDSKPTMVNINYSNANIIDRPNLNIVAGLHNIQILPFQVNKSVIYKFLDSDLVFNVIGDGQNDIEIFKKSLLLNKNTILIGNNALLKPFANKVLANIEELYLFLKSYY